jgi:IclR family pca regulon transcriptional regulator
MKAEQDSKEIGKEEKAPWFSESLARGLLVIQAFDASGPNLRSTEIAKRCGLSRAATRRFLLTLQSLGYIGSDDDRYYLQPKVLDLGFAFVSSMQIDRLVQPLLNELSTITAESCSFAVLDNDQALFVARASGPKILQMAVGIGGRVPAHTTSLGHALLSALPQDKFEQYMQSKKGLIDPQALTKLRASVEKGRANGWVEVKGLLHAAITGVAAPIRNRSGELIGAINVASYGSATTKSMRAHVEPLLEVTRRIEKSLQAAGHILPTATSR